MLQYLKISHKTNIVLHKANCHRHITHRAKYPSFRFVIPHWKDPLNTLSEFISTKHILYMRHILYEHNCNWWAKDICIVKGEVLKEIYRDREFQEIYIKKKYRRGNPHTVTILIEQNHDIIIPLECCHNSHENKNCRQYKLLGIYLDECLSLDHHVDYECNKRNRSLYCIKQAKDNLSQQALKSLYYALVHSHLTCCPIFLSCTSQPT